jgi:rhodanese-related sulfurtransferase
LQSSSKRFLLPLAALILIAGIIPVFHYWYYVGRVPGMTPLQAGELLSTQADAALVDVRNADKYNQLHVENAQNWQYTEIKNLGSGEDLPQYLQGKTVFLICDGGVLSARATQLLRNHYGVEAYSVEGGMQAWISKAGKTDGISLRFIGPSGEFMPAPFKTSPWYEQLALTGAVAVIKPLYMLIALVLIILLWKLKSPDGLSLRWGLTFFLAGETACAVNILFFSHSSYLLEFFHMYGMVLSFAFFSYALFEMLDVRMLGYSDPDKKCAMLGICRQCIKYGTGSCGLKRLFYFLIPSLIILAFIPLIVNFNALSYNTKILGMSYNLSHPIVFQFFELRYAPIYAIILTGITFLVFIITKAKNMSFLKMLLAAGIGPLAFSFLRLLFFNAYHDNLVWANSWEELTELMYTSGVAYTLWIFQPGIFGFGSKKEGPKN